VKNISTHLASQKPEQKQPGITAIQIQALAASAKTLSTGSTLFLAGGGLGPQRGGSSVKVSTNRGGRYLT